MNWLIPIPDLGEQLANTTGDEKDEMVAEYKIIVHGLSKTNYTLLRALFAFIVSISENYHLNKTDRRNVGIDLTSILHLPAPASEKFLNAFDGIFDEPFDEEPHRSNNTGPRIPMNPGLAADILGIIGYLKTLVKRFKTS